METVVLENYIQMAEKAFDSNDYAQGMKYLEEVLMLEPHYGKAHNHMGWLYIYSMKDWGKAETHLNLAMKYAPNYAPVYLHMSHILFEQGRFYDLEKLLEKANQTGGVQKTFIWGMLAKIKEVNGQYREAIKLTKKAIRWSLDDQEFKNLREDIKRCRKKRLAQLF
jgi:Tfp pilus assembly protein PilF